MNRAVFDLITLLKDKEARIDERDDAAIELGQFDDSNAFDALFEVASDTTESWILQASCGESIAEIWIRNDQFEIKVFQKLCPAAQSEVKGLLEGKSQKLFSLYLSLT